MYTPEDFLDPKWESATRVHEWKNYISDEVRDMWGEFTGRQRAALARQAQVEADSEIWD